MRRRGEPAGTRPPTLTPHGVEPVIAALERLRQLLPAPLGMAMTESHTPARPTDEDRTRPRHPERRG
ncbi:MAG: hypothetical protein ACRDRU_10460 [Pseudonocardiaceae bacterium]